MRCEGQNVCDYEEKIHCADQSVKGKLSFVRNALEKEGVIFVLD